MKRFYKAVSVEDYNGGYQICLDGRPVRSPAKAVLRVPTEELAEAVQAEWLAVEDEIQPDDMPMHAMMVTVVDRVTPQREALADELVRYAIDDVLRYRSADDLELAARQKEVWDPLSEHMQTAAEQADLADSLPDVMPFFGVEC